MVRLHLEQELYCHSAGLTHDSLMATITAGQATGDADHCIV